MARSIFIAALLLAMARWGAAGDCQALPLWPLPSDCTFGDLYSLELDLSSFLLRPVGFTNSILTAGIQRAAHDLKTKYTHRQHGVIEPHLVQSPLPAGPTSAQTQPCPSLLINVTSNADSDRKRLNTDESYQLEISQDAVVITAPTIWGALYGLTTLTQLVMHNSSTDSFVIQGAPLSIRDSPRYPWRGFLLDTANHFISVTAIKTLVDQLSLNRFNVLHWHLEDSYSFPFQSVHYRLLSSKGAWSPDAIYTHADVKSVEEYARMRGVRVVLELDVPGHTFSWGLGYPDVTVPCPPRVTADIGPINSVGLDPTRNETYEMVRTLLGELAGLVLDEYIHLGGDEVQFECWNNSKAVTDWMKEHAIPTFPKLWEYFENRTLPMLANLKRQPMVWEEAFRNTVLPRGSIVEVWKGPTSVQLALNAGMDVVLAYGWYLDRQEPVNNRSGWFWEDTWAIMYGVDPDSLPPQGDDDDKDGVRSGATGKVLGGEANMWSEQVSDLNIQSRVWPRACAVAERLWSPAAVSDAGKAAQRLARHRCRLAAQGYPTGPIWADYCSADLLTATPAPAPASSSSNRETTSVLLILAAVFFTGLGAVLMLVFYRARAGKIASIAPVPGVINVSETTPLLARVETSDGSSAESASLVRAGVAGGGVVAASAHTPPSTRVKSFDVFRGFTVALMILVDNLGSAFPVINHCPWDGVRLADFVVPFFDFLVGVSIAISFRNHGFGRGTSTLAALKKVFVRFTKLFLIGLATQGGVSLFVYDLSMIRIMGILQRVAVCYLVGALVELLCPRRALKPATCHAYATVSEYLSALVDVFAAYKYQWVCVICLCSIHTAILYGVDVPPAFGLPCGRGVLTVPCNAASYVDRLILGENHMYYPANGGSPDGDMTFQRSEECTTCYPGKCAPPPDAPEWCAKAPFDPEGLVSSLTCVVATIVGLHFGHILLGISSTRARLMHWFPISAVMLVAGLAMHYGGVPMNTDLYSMAFLLVTTAACGLMTCLCYWIVDIANVGEIFWTPFMHVGMNAILIYLLAEGGLVTWLLSWCYYGDPDRSLVNLFYPSGVYWGDDDDNIEARTSWTENKAVLLWTLAYIGVWMILARILFVKKIFVII